MNQIADQLGEIGLPEPVSALAARHWDTVVVGGGHNGLTCAAYLARAGQSVLVLEARSRLGGACTLERPFPDPAYVVSPCAYVIGLLDDKVISELRLHERGLEVYLADPQLWVPFDDGTAFAQWMDHDRTQAGLEALGLSRRDIEGYFAYEDLFDQIRIKLRKGRRDAWAGPSPSRAELEELLGHDSFMCDVRVPRLDLRRGGPLRLRPATQGRAVRPGHHRHVRRTVRPGHGGGEADALLGGGAGSRRGVGLRARRHGHGELRDRGRGPRGRCGAGGRRSRGRGTARARGCDSMTGR